MSYDTAPMTETDPEAVGSIQASRSDEGRVPQPLKLRLYVAQGAANSDAAIDNLRRVLHDSGIDEPDLEIVDVFEDPQRSRDDGIRMTPTLVKLAPGPRRQLVGTLADTAALRRALDLDRD